MQGFDIRQLGELNELEMLVYQYVLEHTRTVPYMRIRELAAEARVSTTTVLHFCKKMGCEGYAQFKAKLKEQLGAQATGYLPEERDELHHFFEQVAAPEYQERLDEAAACIAKAERVVLVGIGNSGCIAEYGARYFSNMGKFALSVSDPFYPVTMNSTLPMAAVLLSVSGETEQVLRLAQDLKQRGCSLVALTRTETSALARAADLVLPYSIRMHRQGQAKVDFTSQLPAVYLLEEISRRVYNRLLE